jgi:hypothetical protein
VVLRIEVLCKIVLKEIWMPDFFKIVANWPFGCLITVTARGEGTERFE